MTVLILTIIKLTVDRPTVILLSVTVLNVVVPKQLLKIRNLIFFAMLYSTTDI